MSSRSPSEDEKEDLRHSAALANRHSRESGNPGLLPPHRISVIGVGNGFRRPRPPNRACGSPAHGSPVGGFLIGIGSLAARLKPW